MDFSNLFKMLEPFLNSVVNKNTDNQNHEKSSEYNSEPVSNISNVKSNPIEVITKDANNNPITIPKSNNGDIKMLRNDIYPNNFGYNSNQKTSDNGQHSGGPLSNILGNITNGNINIEELISLAQKVLPLLSEFQGGGGGKSSNILGSIFGKKSKTQSQGSDEIHIEETDDDEIVVEDLIRVN